MRERPSTLRLTPNGPPPRLRRGRNLRRHLCQQGLRRRGFGDLLVRPRRSGFRERPDLRLHREPWRMVGPERSTTTYSGVRRPCAAAHSCNADLGCCGALSLRRTRSPRRCGRRCAPRPGRPRDTRRRSAPPSRRPGYCRFRTRRHRAPACRASDARARRSTGRRRRRPRRSPARSGASTGCLRSPGEQLPQPFRHDEAQHAVAEKFEPLVILRRLAAMRQRTREGSEVGGCPAEGLRDPAGEIGGQKPSPIRFQRAAVNQLTGLNQR